MTARRVVALVAVASLVLASLGSPLVGTASATTENVALYDANGNQISTATDGQTVYINANVSNVNGTVETATVTNGSGTSISVDLYDDGSTTGGPGDDTTDGEYWGSFTVSASSTDDSNDVLRVAAGSDAEVSVDLDGQNDPGTATVTADYGPTPVSAATVDADGNGTVDNVTVTFDEAVGSASYATGDFTVSGATVTGIASNDGDDTLRLEVDSAPTNDTGITPDVTVAQDAVQDTNGNTGPASGDVTVTAADGAAPQVVSIESIDASSEDGTVDRIDVTYSEDVSTSSPESGDYALGGADAGRVTLGSPVTSADTVRLPVSAPADDTGLDLTLSYDRTAVTPDSVVDGAGNVAPSFTGRTVADGAGPVIASATTNDTNADGVVDEIDVVFTEPVDDGTVDDVDFVVLVGPESKTVTGIDTGTPDDNATTLQMSGFSTDTGVTPDLSPPQNRYEDLAGNSNPPDIATADDGAPPVATAAETADTDNDGTVDQVNVTLSESISDADSTLDSTTFSAVTGATVGAASTGTTADDDRIVVGVSGTPTDDTGVTLSDLTLSAGAISDGSNENVVQTVGTVTDGAGPLMQSVNTTDADRDGAVDALNVTFTEPVDDSTLDPTDFPLIVSPASVDSVTNSLSTDDNRTQLIVTGFSNTNVTPDVGILAGSITDLAGTPNSPFTPSVTATDRAPPVVTAATTKDTNGDGSVDRIDVTLSEPIDDGASTLDASAFSLSAGSVDGVSTGTADDDAVRLSVSGLSGSDATPDVTLAADSIYDPVGNAIGSTQTFTGTTSGAAPVVESATTLDRDGDGDVDAATLTFTGAIDDSTVTPGDWAIGGTATDAVDTLSTADDDRLQLRITTDADEVSGTDAVDVTYTPGSTASLAGNAIAGVSAGDVAETDGAAPVVTDLSATTNDGRPRIQVQVTASEPLDAVEVDLSGPRSRTLSTFSVSGSGPYVHTLSYRAQVSGQYTATLQRAVDAAGNGAAVGQEDSAGVDLPDDGGSPVSRAPGSPADRVSSSTALVFSDTESVTFDLGAGTIGRVAVTSRATGNGFARSTTLTSPPQGVTTPGDPVVGFVSIQLPDDWRSTPATLRLTVDTSGTSADAADLRIARYDEATSSWETFETTVESRRGSTVVLAAEVPRFSTFAIVESPETTDDVTPTPTPTAVPTESDGEESDSATASPTATPAEAETVTDTSTPSSAATTAGNGPGFGALASLAALAALTALVARRRRRD